MTIDAPSMTFVVFVEKGNIVEVRSFVKGGGQNGGDTDLKSRTGKQNIVDTIRAIYELPITGGGHSG